MARPDPPAPSSHPFRPAGGALPRPWAAGALWLGPILAVLALALLYAGAIRTGFLNDDYIFLEQARTHPVLGSLLSPGAIGNYFRPLSRQLYFEALTPLGGGQPLIFHAVNFGLFLVTLALLFDLLAGLLPFGAAAAGTLYFALLPLQRVNLTWISCSQDLLALTLTLAALALYRRGRVGMALAAAFGAVASKEIALGLPVALVAWSRFIERLGPRAALRRALPFFALSGVWGALGLRVALAAAPADGGLHFDPGHFAAGLVHAAQSLLGLENPTGIVRALTARGPAPLPLVLLAVLALWLPARDAGEEKSDPRAIAWFAAAWVLGFGLLTGPVAGIWSAYFYTVPAVGGALLVGLLFRRAGRPAWLILVPLLLWWHEGGTGTRAFAVRENPWGWTSHLTSAYFERAARLTGDLSRQLREIEPAPPRGGRLIFATLPPWAGFQTGNGALARALYRDPSLESYFFSQFDESTVDSAPCRFYWWDGAGLRPLYREAADPFFQVGADLLLLDRPAGAAHAFHRALAAGGYRPDDFYWLGWAELWNGRRDEAEAAWRSLGAADDTARWRANMAAARMALVSLRDTLEGRRTLVEAIRYGMGRPEPHGVLGGLLLARQPKYGMLELKVATTLNPDDWQSRRALLAALLDAHLASSARRELEALLTRSPELATDPIVARARRELGSGDEPASGVVEF
jgi:hypothetical protein